MATALPGMPSCPPGYTKQGGRCAPASAGTTMGPPRTSLPDVLPPPPTAARAPSATPAASLKPNVPTLTGGPAAPTMPTGPRTGEPAPCPPGYTRGADGLCASPPPDQGGSCPPGYYNNGSGTCIYNGTGGAPTPQTGTGTVPTCPPGRHWSTPQNTCVADVTGTPAQTPTETTLNSTDCPPGMHWNNNAKQCRPGPGPSGTAAGGGGGAAAGGGGVGAAGVGTGDNVSNDLLAYIRQLFDPNSGLMLGSKAALLSASEGRRKAGEQQLNEDLIRRNIYRSGIAARGNVELSNEATSSYTSNVRDLEINMKLRGLDAMQKWLDSLRQFYLGNKTIEAQLKLGYAKIASEKELLQMQLDHMGGGGGGGQDDFLTFLQGLQTLNGGR